MSDNNKENNIIISNKEGLRQYGLKWLKKQDQNILNEDERLPLSDAENFFRNIIEFCKFIYNFFDFWIKY